MCSPPPPAPPTECRVKAINFNYCFADIDRSHAVDVDDLIAVILEWGACPTSPAGFSPTTRPPCPGDVAPNVCGNDAVDVDDLIEVILAWGPCLNPAEPCGSYVPPNAHADEGVPETPQECYEDCIEKHPEGGQAFIDCYNGCLQALDFIP
jgi:hypothetical protein